MSLRLILPTSESFRYMARYVSEKKSTSHGKSNIQSIRLSLSPITSLRFSTLFLHLTAANMLRSNGILYAAALLSNILRTVNSASLSSHPTSCSPCPDLNGTFSVNQLGLYPENVDFNVDSCLLYIGYEAAFLDDPSIHHRLLTMLKCLIQCYNGDSRSLSKHHGDHLFPQYYAYV